MDAHRSLHNLETISGYFSLRSQISFSQILFPFLSVRPVNWQMVSGLIGGAYKTPDSTGRIRYSNKFDRE